MGLSAGSGSLGRLNIEVGYTVDKSGLNQIKNSFSDGQWMLSAIDLWHNLTKEQQQECKQDGDHKEFEPPGCWSEVNKMIEEIGTEHNDGHIHKIIRNENGGERTL